ncbi:MAG: DUF370 domain-containing protein [Candidatus Infernicultor aquiphilus]|uniref:Putative regulatory protein AUK42_03230 n=1 Tax=Candidatus Infernicultor aquiphilus TaxID=1805029 RepID=A0A1J5GG23_9BACT|nr:DUF370 domain-containing protein [bacterium]OIP71681.1 MAG: hypothetical protein AUK42_03230 [Candidatus Atribacteria bacterium CG2_30_33_13]PIU24759.1 MAG: DUF370 domain-containing protein [Candidatus Atribacteria bacterium CG08_land_8_20_14_0_20_33_29]PIW11841.1 MAG: DUF370 domain-containing protein [Candidatus Atribacteria bacterium CG17_big_fil_post_rev_8_21_14_2_50_34_11]PIX35299.1 MAG: DUF370 domain-containing protein [Candidatus Atribacteria bacterium CG_4_8_14_3_um_filter_34_18]PIY3
MVNNLVNIGFGNFVNSTRVITILNPEPRSAPMKRIKEEAKIQKKLIDATYGRRTRAIIITDSNHIILSSIQPETIAHRFTEATGQNLELKENVTK